MATFRNTGFSGFCQKFGCDSTPQADNECISSLFVRYVRSAAICLTMRNGLKIKSSARCAEGSVTPGMPTTTMRMVNVGMPVVQLDVGGDGVQVYL